ncbi:MAG: DUF512 domain-containing protein, partial [Oscillospiraceae bacterium]|nr:DUF512 domain-containing protein [Oscillospiraceae bacterium]
GITYHIYPIKNSFYGGGVTVTGLITGTDLLTQLKGKPLGRRVLISTDMLRREERDFLDSISLEEAEKTLGVSIIPVISDGGELCDAMLGADESHAAPGLSGETEFNKYNPPRKRG